MTDRTVLVLLFDGVQSLDVTGPVEVFTGAGEYVARRGAEPGYRIRTVSPGGTPVRTSSGLTIVPDGALPARPSGVDTIVVPGGTGVRTVPGIVDWLRVHAGAARRVVSVCTGAFVLADAGLLDGRRATTHWAYCAELAARRPAVDVDPDPIFIRSGNVVTSAGVTAGIDLALALVEDDLGRDAALAVARWLVMFLRRPANQAQFSVQLAAQAATREPLRDLQRWITDHPDADLSVRRLAESVNLSPRQFARAFRAEVGVTPAAYVGRIRLEAARRRLEDSADGVEEIARGCGFGTPESMRRAFVRALGVPPLEYRRRVCPA